MKIIMLYSVIIIHGFRFFAANNPPTLTVDGGTDIIYRTGTPLSLDVTVSDPDDGDTATLEKVNRTVLNTDCLTITGVTTDRYMVVVDNAFLNDLENCDIA